MVEAGAAVLLGHRDAEEAELGHALDELRRVAVLAIDLGRLRQHLGLGEVARGLLDGLLVFGEVELHLCYCPLNCAARRGLARNAAMPSR